jgi:hypothetical protein
VITRVSVGDFRDSFARMDRMAGWTYDGLGYLYEYLESLEFGDDEYELDVIGLCCEYTEYENISEYNKQMDTGFEDTAELSEETAVILAGKERFICQDY